LQITNVEQARKKIMPHVIVKLYSGRSEQQKIRLAEEITKAVMAVLKSDEKSISVCIEDIKPEDWAEKVYKPDILGNPKLYKKAAYNPL
jgi:4-oxalocrotonate tautomerase